MATVSIIIPAYNEAENLPDTLEALGMALIELTDQVEIIVVDNNSSDSTAEVAKKLGVRVVFEPVNQIARARNAGARAACGEYLVFLDADTLLPPALLRTALEELSSGVCCGGGARIAFDQPLPLAARFFVLAWDWISVHGRLAAGSFFFCLREGFLATGGFSEKVYAGEEIWFSRALKRWGSHRGLHFVIIPSPPVVTSARKFQWYSAWRFVIFILLNLAFPFAARFRCLCPLWYRRPPAERHN